MASTFNISVISENGTSSVLNVKKDEPQRPDDLWPDQFPSLHIRHPRSCKTAANELTVLVLRDRSVPQFFCLARLLRSSREVNQVAGRRIFADIALVLNRFTAPPISAENLALEINYGSWLSRYSAHLHVKCSNVSSVIKALETQGIPPAESFSRRPGSAQSTDALLPLGALPHAPKDFLPSSVGLSSFVELLTTCPETLVSLFLHLRQWWEGYLAKRGGFALVVSDLFASPSSYHIRIVGNAL